MKDYLVRALTKDGNFRALVASTTLSVKVAQRKHSCYPTALVALGRAMTGAALLAAAGLKEHQRLALKIEGNGPLQKILAEADSSGAIRGYVAKPDIEIPTRNGKLDVASAIGRAGLLTITKDLGLKEPYHGTVHLQTSEIAEDLAYYLTESEQLPSAVGLGVYLEPEKGIRSAGGFLVQALPNADPEMIEQITTQISQLPPITTLLKDKKVPEEILALIFQAIPYEILETKELFFRCSCSISRVKNALISLGKSELEAIMAEHGDAEVKCEFCRTRYVFPKEDLQEMIKNLEA